MLDLILKNCTLPDGTPYDANDPELLTWIHVAEVRMFLSGYLPISMRKQGITICFANKL